MPRIPWRRRKGHARLGIFGDVQEGDYVCTPWGTIGFVETLKSHTATILVNLGQRQIVEQRFLRTVEQDGNLAWLDFKEGEG